MCFCLSHSLFLCFLAGVCSSQCLSLSVLISDSVDLYVFVSLTLCASVCSQVFARPNVGLCLFVYLNLCFVCGFVSLNLSSSVSWLVFACPSVPFCLFVCLNLWFLYISFLLSVPVCLGGYFLVPVSVYVYFCVWICVFVCFLCRFLFSLASFSVCMYVWIMCLYLFLSLSLSVPVCQGGLLLVPVSVFICFYIWFCLFV